MFKKWLLIFIFLLSFSSVSFATDTKITAFTADTSPTSDDLVPTVNDPSGTPANRKVTLSNLKTFTNTGGTFYIDTVSPSTYTTVTFASNISLGTYRINSTSGSYIDIEQPSHASSVTLSMGRTGRVVPLCSPLSAVSGHGVKLSITNGDICMSDAGVAIPLAGSGDTVGPNGATSDSVAIYSGVTGKILKNSLCKITTDGTLTCPSFVSTTIGPITNLGTEAGNASLVLGADESDDALDTATIQMTATDDTLRFINNSAVLETMTSDGKIGIGTTAPSVPLHVVGNARISGLVSCNTIDTDSSGNLVCGTDSGGAGTFVFAPQIQSAHLPISNAAQIDSSGGQWAVLYDPSTAQIATFDTVMYPYAGGALNGQIIYSMASATSGTVEFDVQIGCITAGTDSIDVDLKTLGTANVFTGTVPGTAGYEGLITVNSLSQNSCAAGDQIIVSVNRDATDAVNDTATGNAELRKVLLYE